MSYTIVDKCIVCGEELVLWERNRTECFECRDRAVEAYGDDHQEKENA